VALRGDAYELTLERRGLVFRAGHLVTLHGRDTTEDRDYSICSGPNDAHLQILYKHMPNGRLTSQLALLEAGDTVDVTGPHGQFTLRDPGRPLVFIATGTGIAPCRAFVRAYPDLDLTVIHGVPGQDALYYRAELSLFTYRPCLSRETRADCFRGRVTDLVRETGFADGSHFYLCGAFEMIAEVSEILERRGVARENVLTETYYYGADA
jgi:NAD(P)H-flavin reductase